MLIKFNNNLKTGISDIDEQHEELFNLINKLAEIIEKKGALDKIWQIIIGLEVYVSSHFDTEENYMKKFGYQESEIHSQKHLEFKNSFKEVKEKLEKEGISSDLVKNLITFSANWISTHYKDEDINLAEFLRKKLK